MLVNTAVRVMKGMQTRGQYQGTSLSMPNAPIPIESRHGRTLSFPFAFTLVTVPLTLKLQEALPPALPHSFHVCCFVTKHWWDLCFQSLIVAVAGLFLSRPRMRRSSRWAPSLFLRWHLDHVVESWEEKLFVVALEHQLVLEKGHHVLVGSSYSIVVVAGQDENDDSRHSKSCCS